MRDSYSYSALLGSGPVFSYTLAGEWGTGSHLLAVPRIDVSRHRIRWLELGDWDPLVAGWDGGLVERVSKSLELRVVEAQADKDDTPCTAAIDRRRRLS